MSYSIKSLLEVDNMIVTLTMLQVLFEEDSAVEDLIVASLVGHQKPATVRPQPTERLLPALI